MPSFQANVLTASRDVPCLKTPINASHTSRMHHSHMQQARPNVHIQSNGFLSQFSMSILITFKSMHILLSKQV